MRQSTEASAALGQDGSGVRPVDQTIERALIRLEDAARRRPGFGHSTGTSISTMTDGLRCVTRDGDHRIRTDLPPAFGGEATGPTPSTLLRAALGSCLAMGYRLRGARHGVAVEGIRVEVETDAAVAGMLDPDSDLPPGFLEIRYRVEINGPTPTQIDRLVHEGDRLSPVLDAVSRASRVIRLPSSRSTALPGGES